MHNRCNSSEEFSCNEVKQQLRVDKQKLFVRQPYLMPPHTGC